jgi:antitoxin MazE
MQVKMGQSLAVRLPSALVEALDLKEGDQIEIQVAGKRKLEIARDRNIEKALERIRQLRRPLACWFRIRSPGRRMT